MLIWLYSFMVIYTCCLKETLGQAGTAQGDMRATVGPSRPHRTLKTPQDPQDPQDHTSYPQATQHCKLSTGCTIVVHKCTIVVNYAP